MEIKIKGGQGCRRSGLSSDSLVTCCPFCRSCGGSLCQASATSPISFGVKVQGGIPRSGISNFVGQPSVDGLLDFGNGRSGMSVSISISTDVMKAAKGVAAELVLL